MTDNKHPLRWGSHQAGKQYDLSLDVSQPRSFLIPTLVSWAHEPRHLSNNRGNAWNPKALAEFMTVTVES